MRKRHHIREYDTWLVSEAEVRDQRWYQHHSAQSTIKADQINHIMRVWSRLTGLNNNQIKYTTHVDVKRLREALGEIFVADSIGGELYNLEKELKGDTSLLLSSSPLVTV